MTKRFGPLLLPALLVASGIVLATLLAVHAQGSLWLALAAALLLTLVVLAADALEAWIQEGKPRVSAPAWILGASFLLAGVLVGVQDPGKVKTLMPLLGTVSWVVLLTRVEEQRRACRIRISE